MLFRSNNLGQNAVIRTGDRLIVASGRAVPSASAGSAGRSRSASGHSRSGMDGSEASATYRVRRGDTLFKIASRLSTTVEEICRLNNLSLGDTLLPGTLLKIER